MPAPAGDNPIFDRFFKHAHIITTQTFDDARSVIFRKHKAMWDYLVDAKPSSVPTAELVERTGSRAVHHVLWLQDEGSALRESISYRDGRRGAGWTRRNEEAVRDYLNRLYRALSRLRQVAK